MQGIFNAISRMRQLQVIMLVNRIIYLMQKIIYVGRFFSEQTYAAFRTKRIIGAIAVVLMLVGGLLEILLYLGGMLALPILLWTEGYNTTEQFALFLHMYFCISGVMAGMTSAKVLESNKMKYTAVRLMRIAPTRFMRAELFYRYTTFFLYQGIALTLVSLLFDFSIFHALLAVGVMTIWRVLSEWIHLAVFRWKGTILVQKTGVMGLVMLLTLAAAYLPLTSLSIPLFGAVILEQWWLVTLISLSGTVAGYILFKHTDFTAAVRAVTNQADPLLNREIMMANIQQQMMQATDNDAAQYTSSNLHARRQTSLGEQGYEQMHNLLLSRYRHLTQVPFRRRLVAIVIIGIVLSLSAFIVRDHVSLNAVEQYSPILIMVMLSLTIGREVCKGLFLHCDMQLMHYSFYRKHAKQHFRLRFRSLLFLNLKLGVCLATVLKCTFTCFVRRKGYPYIASHLGYDDGTVCIFLSTSSIAILCVPALHNIVGHQQSSFHIREQSNFIRICYGNVCWPCTVGPHCCLHGVDFRISVQCCTACKQICSKQFQSKIIK
ncbi:hypothetical protein P9222_21575 [Paenibacillus amylolyticus]|nr:hypothetical protein [Paenibacillus amylolyticus]WFR61083.1 hypothetical protein P9222_21575 [Paenibacillus amylolyticus]